MPESDANTITSIMQENDVPGFNINAVEKSFAIRSALYCCIHSY